MPGHRTAALSWIGITLLGGATVALALAPLALPPDYSTVEWTTSYSAAQGVRGAWVARLGFVLAGCAALTLTVALRHRWRQPATSLHVAVGVAFLVIATFSVRPWIDTAPYDHVENLLHGIAATVMGLAFAVGVGILVWLRWRDHHTVDQFGAAVAVVSLIAPPTWGVFTGAAGVIQRAMLLTWGAWYLVEVRAAWEGRAER